MVHQKLIVDAALVFASMCFLVYVVLSLAPVILAWKEHKRARKSSRGADALAAPVPIDFAGLVKAFATLVDSLVKAGPALWALIGSMLFLLIAGFAAGVFRTS